MSIRKGVYSWYKCDKCGKRVYVDQGLMRDALDTRGFEISFECDHCGYAVEYIEGKRYKYQNVFK